MQDKKKMNSDCFSKDLGKATEKKLKLFEQIRGKEGNLSHFWDVVVLSALDAAQKKAYETQLDEKLARKELPLLPKYHVIHDPIGYKVGNGGGVIAVLDELSKIYKDNLNTKKVLILLSGGYSQRLPSASLLGKIFTALPLGNPIYQMIELKLAMYIEFPQRMRPGVFVSSADCLELYELEGEDWNFNHSGVTSLAHPSPIELGTTHGVYVLDNPVNDVLVNLYEADNKKNVRSSYTGTCRRFLHKPSKELMRSSGAVFTNHGEEYIYSDSAYFMDMETCFKLLDWYNKHGEIKCEIDAYGDFLQALGPEATSDYCKNVSNVTIALPDLIKTRQEIFQVLSNTQLNVLMLNKSKFYHIGTTKEYLYHFCEDTQFRNEISCSNQAMLKCMKPVKEINSTNIFIHSTIQNTSGIQHNVVIEYTSLNFANDIGANSIISNCTFPSGVRIPAMSFIYTAIIRDKGATLYVTVAFGIEDNLKKCCSKRSETNSLSYAGLPFGDVLEKLNIYQDPWSEDCVQLNLWNAKIFPAFFGPEDSLRYAAETLSSCRNNSKYTCRLKRAIYSCSYSMADILRMKDLKKILEMRNNLRLKILS